MHLIQKDIWVLLMVTILTQKDGGHIRKAKLLMLRDPPLLTETNLTQREIIPSQATMPLMPEEAITGK